MTQIRQDAIKLLEQIPEDKIIFIIQYCSIFINIIVYDKPDKSNIGV